MKRKGKKGKKTQKREKKVTKEKKEKKEEKAEEDTQKVTISFQPDGRKVTVPSGATILDAAVEAGVGVEGPCGGQGTCGKCKVHPIPAEDGRLPVPTDLERETMTREELEDEGLRLACQVRVEVDCTVEVPKDSRMYKHMILMTGLESATPPVPNVTVTPIRDEEKGIVGTLVNIGEKVVARRKGADLGVYGIAVDLGTTTVVCHLVDLREGATVASAVALNPQVARGDDVIARIRHASSPDGAAWMTSKAREVVNGLIADACGEAGIDAGDIFEMAFAGNTCMHHLFFGLPVASLGEAPYLPACTGPMTMGARQAGVDINPAGQVYSLPVLAGFLGADATAVALTAALDCYEGTRMAIDIGTNGEILLCHGGRIFGCSSPAGPAFEGAQISCGMRAARGAISYLRIEDGEIRVSVIGGGRPRGIAGSAIVDAAAELIRTGHLDRSGRLIRLKDGVVRKGAEGLEFVVAAGKDTHHGKDIVLTQRDIRQLQLAKGAIAAGISMVLDAAGISEEDLDDIFVAGAFGNYIDRGSAMEIGLLPRLDPRHIVSIGNAAAIGAKRALVSLSERARAEAIQKKLNHVELATRKDFQDVFMAHIHF